MIKVIAFLKKYWIFILVIPAVLIGISYVGKIISRIVRKPDQPPSQIADTNRLNDDIHKIDNATDAAVDKIDAVADAKKTGIDSGDPTPAKVFDDTIRGGK